MKTLEGIHTDNVKTVDNLIVGAILFLKKLGIGPEAIYLIFTIGKDGLQNGWTQI